jgi:hypothetical protein
MMSTTKVNCPECNCEIDVNDILKHQIEESIRKEFLAKESNSKKALKVKEIELEQQKKDFEDEKNSELEKFNNRLEVEVRKSIKEKEVLLKSKLNKESSEQIKLLNDELNEKSEKLIELNKSKSEIERLKREKNELKETIEAETQLKLNETILIEKIKIKKQAEESNVLVVRELKKQLEDQKKLTDDMKRKQEQGSMQLQGEIQELAIEEWLSDNFRFDNIEEIKKGANGADCMQTVNTREIQNCGKIYYESKRTKGFQVSWIEKFKNDIREKGANIGVLVTEVLPNGMDRMGLKDGIWICNFEEFKGLSAVLRQSVIKINSATISQEGKSEKMDMLYGFLTSNEFRLQMEGIVEGFTQMQIDLNSEKNAMKRLWKKREKQIDKVINNTVNMHGAIKGIAGNAIGEIDILKLE